ncbi:MAG: hypothetical protein FJZ47_01485 [Candidatus Tectomicrobia bacterium]|uniref:Globin domain-containing protein n=1 Tax=Tectimicrobiota bacterium TaxID=2528274 RepID=A0A938B247_UNCTE|nr:hypothetical protein [Candidatus Tectomicrobia bacterium]
MIQEHIGVVQSSFAKLAPRASQVAARFYARLFTLDPTLRRLFPDDLHAQGVKLMQALSLVVSSLHQFDTLMPTL